ncbi:MAG: PEGA domain-containing protein [Planctomycetaceae bacterium]
MRNSPSPWRSSLLLAAGLAGCALAGCQSMHRRMTVHSDPPGAMVLVDGEEQGHTPMSMDFIYYATREITLVKDGYETLTVFQKVPTPWYQYFPLDFATDNFLPFKVTNRHEFTYKLQPQVAPSTEHLYDMGQSMRNEAAFGP